MGGADWFTIIGYPMVGLVIAFAVASWQIRGIGQRRQPDGTDAMIAGALGLIVGALWPASVPLAAFAAATLAFAERDMRKRTKMREESERA